MGTANTDLVKFACPACETEWDVWGTLSESGRFRPERSDAAVCPTCDRFSGKPKREDDDA